MCIVTGPRQYSTDLPQGGLEIPCSYIFRTNNQAESDKTRKLLQTVLEIAITQTSEEEPTLLEVHHPEKEVNTFASKETLVVTTSIHENFPYSTYQEFQCSHRSTDPLPVVTIHEECIDKSPTKKRKLSEIDIEGIIMGEELSVADITWPKDYLRHSSLNWVAYSLLFYSKKKILIPEKK